MSVCNLRFTRNSPLRTALVDEATGHAMYQIDTPIRISGSVTRIRRLDSHTPHPLHHDDDADSDSGDDITNMKKRRSGSAGGRSYEEGHEEETGPELAETSDEVARIYWKWFSSDRIVFRGKEHLRTDFLPKCGKMKGSYMFTGPDGVQYRWALSAIGVSYPKLVTTDEKKSVIAEYHRARHFMRREKPLLEVQPAGMDMLDYIVLTFVFAENKRRERETRMKAGKGGGGGGGGGDGGGD